MLTLRFTTTKKSFVSEAIRLLTWSPYSHVEFLIPGEGYLGAHVNGGVLLRPFDYDNGCEFCFATVNCKPTVEKAVLEYARAQLGKPYDLKAVLGIGFHRDWEQSGSWFCSELVAASFNAGGYPLVRASEKLDRITPRDIYDSALIQVIGTACNCTRCGQFDQLDPTRAYDQIT
jgi:uncharacterized protein YycO